MTITTPLLGVNFLLHDSYAKHSICRRRVSCVCVCVSVYLSVRHTPVLYQNG